jgi:hypothetical protein
MQEYGLGARLSGRIDISGFDVVDGARSRRRIAVR